LTLGCQVKFKTTEIDLPVKVEKPTDFKAGTHYPKLQPKKMWLVHIVMPKQLLNDIKEGSIDLADQTVDLSALDDAYAEDLQKDQSNDVESKSQQNQQPTPDLGLGGLGAPAGLGGATAPPPPGGGF
jgi:hypothetical protein